MNDFVGRRWILVHGLDPGGTPILELESGPEEVERESFFFELMWQDRMYGVPLRTGDRRSIQLSTDFFPTRRDMLNRPFTREYRPDILSVLTICLPSPERLRATPSLRGAHQKARAHEHRAFGLPWTPSAEDHR